MTDATAPSERLDHLDATRAFALLLGIVFHASLSFMPIFIGWAVQDISTSPLVAGFVTVSHSFRMETFFLLAGFFSHLTFHRRGAGTFLRSRAVRIVVPFIVGWFLLRPLVVSGWIMGQASLRGDYEFWSAIKAGFATLAQLPAGIFTGTHLWFLYYLAMITALALVTRAFVAASDASLRVVTRIGDAMVRWLARSPFGLVALAVPTAAALWFMRFWGMDTPDQSLQPHLPVLAVYTAFFLFGWVLHRTPELVTEFSRLTVSRWTGAVAGVAGTFLLAGIERNPGHPQHTLAHVAFVLSYALMMWSLVVLTIGIFRKLCSRPRPAVRYVADASYWLYLVHLPLVAWGQVMIAEVALHWSLKLGLVSATVIALGLLGYDLLVRSTFVGLVLNGRRRERVLFRWPAGRVRAGTLEIPG